MSTIPCLQNGGSHVPASLFNPNDTPLQPIRAMEGKEDATRCNICSQLQVLPMANGFASHKDRVYSSYCDHEGLSWYTILGQEQTCKFQGRILGVNADLFVHGQTNVLAPEPGQLVEYTILSFSIIVAIGHAAAFASRSICGCTRFS